MKITKALESVAHHEAGHIVAAWLQGFKLKSVTIVPSAGYQGLASLHESNLEGFHPVYDNSEETERKVKALAIWGLAGPAAQRIFNPKGYRHVHVEEDFRSSANILSYIAGSAEDVERKFETVHKNAERLVQDNWHHVEALAEALLKKNTLSGSEIRGLLESDS